MKRKEIIKVYDYIINFIDRFKGRFNLEIFL